MSDLRVLDLTINEAFMKIPIYGSLAHSNWRQLKLDEEFKFKQEMISRNICFCGFLRSPERIYPTNDKCHFCVEVEQMMRNSPLTEDEEAEISSEMDFISKGWIEENINDF
jgi:hypothetical protein